MPEAYDNPFSGLQRGLQSGLTMGLQIRQQNMAEAELVQKQRAAEAELAQKKTQQEFENNSKKATQSMAIIGDANVPESSRLEVYNKSFVPAWNAISPDAPLTNIDALPNDAAKFAKRALAIYNSSDYDLPTKKKFLIALYAEAENANQKASVEGMMKDVTGQQEASMLGQAARIPDLQAGGYLSPEQAKEGTINAYQGGGQAGQDLLKGMLEGGKADKESTQTANLVSPKDGKAHVYKYNPQTDRYDIDQGLAPASSVGRDTYADTQILNRIVDKFNADPTIRAVEKMDEFANIIGEVAISDNPIGHASLETLMARASGEVGNLSEADKKPFGGSRALTAKTKQYFSEIYSGKKTPENIAFIQKLAETFRQAGVNKKRSIARERSKQYAAAHRGKFSEREIFDALSPDGGYIDKPSDRTVTRTGTDRKTGKKVIQYSDGSVEYGN